MKCSASLARKLFICAAAAFAFAGSPAQSSGSPVSFLDRSEVAAAQQKWDTAYRFLEDALESKLPDERARASTIYRSSPQIAMAAARSFSRDTLLASKAEYGDQQSFGIESKRLRQFLLVASPDAAQAAIATFNDVFKAEVIADDARKLQIAREEEERQKQLALAAEERRAEHQARERQEAERRKKLEDEKAKEQAETLLKAARVELAAERAKFACKDRLSCEKAFALTQIFIVKHSEMKIQLANDTVLETYTATEPMKISMRAFKIPRSGQASEITLEVHCKTNYEAELNVCLTKQLAILEQYPIFMGLKLQP